jgi:chromate transport protein ChrA
MARLERSDLGTFVRYFLWLGATGFGGPIATVGYMQRDLVERHRWVSRDDFLDGVALGQAMPGPLAAQVTMWVGYLARGALGALAVAVAFILLRSLSCWAWPSSTRARGAWAGCRPCSTASPRA